MVQHISYHLWLKRGKIHGKDYDDYMDAINYVTAWYLENIVKNKEKKYENLAQIMSNLIDTFNKSLKDDIAENITSYLNSLSLKISNGKNLNDSILDSVIHNRKKANMLNFFIKCYIEHNL